MWSPVPSTREIMHYATAPRWRPEYKVTAWANGAAIWPTRILILPVPAYDGRLTEARW